MSRLRKGEGGSDHEDEKYKNDEAIKNMKER